MTGLVNAGTLQHWAGAVLATQGVGTTDAALTARLLVRTSLRGIDTHGIARLPGYVDRLASGEMNAQARPRTEETAPGWLRCDGGGGLGQVVATHAVEEALARARQQPLVACHIRATGHLRAELQALGERTGCPFPV